MTGRVKRGGDSADSVPQQPQVAPQAVPVQLGHEHSFLLQTIMEMQKSLGQLDSNIAGLRSAVDGLKTKVEDLVSWKNRILGGAAVLAAVIALLGFMLGKASDYIAFKPSGIAPTAAPAPVSPAPPVATSPVAPASPTK